VELIAAARFSRSTRHSRNLFLSTAIVEVLVAFGMVQPPVGAEDVALDLAAILAYEDPAMQERAYHTVSNVFEDVYQGSSGTRSAPSTATTGCGSSLWPPWVRHVTAASLPTGFSESSWSTSNDIVMSTSTDGTSWTAPVRIPIDPTNSDADHFIPGLAADRSTSGTSARLGLTYYFYPEALCSPSTCQLKVGFISSADGGQTWSSPTEVAGPMTLSWLPDTNQGRMVGDYIATSFNASGLAHGVFAVANAPTAGGTDCATATPDCDQAISTTTSGLSTAAEVSVVTPVDKHPVANAAADHAAPQAAFHRR
jgi:hypothetical protein